MTTTYFEICKLENPLPCVTIGLTSTELDIQASSIRRTYYKMCDTGESSRNHPIEPENTNLRLALESFGLFTPGVSMEA